MEKSMKQYAGRTFNAEDIEQIQWTRKAFPQLSETELACTICETLGWVSKSGIPKRVTCKKFLVQLAAEGTIDLPKSRGTGGNTEDRERKAAERVSQLSDKVEEITRVGNILLEIAQAGPRLQLLRAYLRKYHMLGDNGAYGEALYYFITDGSGAELGCMRFSVASWWLEDRETWIGWTKEQKDSRLFLIVNQSRFLIFPWVKVKNLASRALSLAARRIGGDWLERYCYEPVLLETFVDRSHFMGTCYKAANWRLVGQTKGRGRNDRHAERALSIKDIYLYPLRRDCREILRGDKPFKAVNPDE